MNPIVNFITSRTGLTQSYWTFDRHIPKLSRLFVVNKPSLCRRYARALDISDVVIYFDCDDSEQQAITKMNQFPASVLLPIKCLYANITENEYFKKTFWFAIINILVCVTASGIQTDLSFTGCFIALAGEKPDNFCEQTGFKFNSPRHCRILSVFRLW